MPSSFVILWRAPFESIRKTSPNPILGVYEDVKTCQTCHQPKDESEFYKHKGRSDGLRADCKTCGRDSARAFYARNPAPFKARAKKFRHSKRDKRKEFIVTLRAKYGCRLCPERSPEVLDFHHFDASVKLFNITSPRDLSLVKLIQEINKCVVLCANCHRKVHAGTAALSKKHLCKENVPHGTLGGNI